jgi:hypothetical protein
MSFHCSVHYLGPLFKLKPGSGGTFYIFLLKLKFLDRVRKGKFRKASSYFPQEQCNLWGLCSVTTEKLQKKKI